MVNTENVEIGVIGGSGFYSFLDDVTEIQVDTPYGAPSDSLFLGEIAGRRLPSCPATGAATICRRIASTTGPICGRCGP